MQLKTLSEIKKIKFRPDCNKYLILDVVKVKVKCALVQALRLCTGRTAYRGSRGTALLFLDHGTPRRLFTPGKDPVPIVQEDVWAPGPVWTGGKYPPHRDSIPGLV